ncbi:MAG TPA: DUF4238 domain-containing protein [Candidatus Wunengus sp. YC60]|uniref:DUF4238 domain-containing protein n=1 Tax=Candidatus Wunengus sp. YC60 TaxID=3367697 RepID=UPI0040294524
MKGPKDHYVAQTYLRNFSIKNNTAHVNAIRKSDLKRLNNVPVRSICYKVNWSTNPYFPEKPRVVEDYLKIFEPKWFNCVKMLADEKFDAETKYFMSGYIVYLRACTPTAIRLGQVNSSEIVSRTYEIIEQKELSNPDTKHKDAINTIRSHGGIKVNVDPNFPKAMGIRTLSGAHEKLQGFPWLIMTNETGIPYITSDNPVCLRYPQNSAFCDFYVPITPKIAIMIHPLRNPESEIIDSLTSVKPEGVNEFNRLVVKCAEDMVIFNEDFGVEELVKEFRDWRMEVLITKFPVEKGTFNIFQQRPCCRTKESAAHDGINHHPNNSA